MSDTHIIDIYWEGPFKDFIEVSNYVTTNERGMSTDYFFYQIYGEHASYGKDVLLYIGMSENGKNVNKEDGIVSRLKKHNDNWTGGLCSEIKIYIGSYGYFRSWSFWHDKRLNPYYKKPLHIDGYPEIPEIESLLIYAHKPAFNCASIRNIGAIQSEFHIFNTGRRRSIFPELSTKYYKNNTHEECVVLAADDVSS